MAKSGRFPPQKAHTFIHPEVVAECWAASSMALLSIMKTKKGRKRGVKSEASK